MLKGIDISHHNKNMKNKEDLKQFDFVFMKASEGKGFKDYSINQYNRFSNSYVYLLIDIHQVV